MTVNILDGSGGVIDTTTAIVEDAAEVPPSDFQNFAMAMLIKEPDISMANVVDLWETHKPTIEPPATPEDWVLAQPDLVQWLTDKRPTVVARAVLEHFPISLKDAIKVVRNVQEMI